GPAPRPARPTPRPARAGPPPACRTSGARRRTGSGCRRTPARPGALRCPIDRLLRRADEDAAAVVLADGHDPVGREGDRERPIGRAGIADALMAGGEGPDPEPPGRGGAARGDG